MLQNDNIRNVIKVITSSHDFQSAFFEVLRQSHIYRSEDKRVFSRRKSKEKEEEAFTLRDGYNYR